VHRSDGQADRPELNPRSEAFDRAFDHSFSLIAFAMNRHLVDHMLRCTRELGVDFESLVIWGLVCHLNVAHMLPPGSSPSSHLDETGRRLPAAGLGYRPIRLRDLEQIARLPRETIRRKLARLEEQGYLQRTPGGWVLRDDKVEPSLRDFSRETARRQLTLSLELDRLLAAGHAAACREAAAE
jgi:hypothetical protein